MKLHPLIPELLAASNLEGRRRYELWRTPQTKPGFHLYCFDGEVEISRKPMASELRGRIEFERSVEEAS